MPDSKNPHILRIDSSVQGGNSVTRGLTQRVTDRLSAQLGDSVTVSQRDVSTGIPIIDPATVGATFTPTGDRTPEQEADLILGQTLIDEVVEATHLVIGLPMYNFGPPASLKAWADQITRDGVTFRYTETGVEGLLSDTPTYIVSASGGVPIESPMDWATGWLKELLGLIGITSVQVIAAEGTARDLDAALAQANETIDKLLPVGQDG